MIIPHANAVRSVALSSDAAANAHMNWHGPRAPLSGRGGALQPACFAGDRAVITYTEAPLPADKLKRGLLGKPAPGKLPHAVVAGERPAAGAAGGASSERRPDGAGAADLDAMSVPLDAPGASPVCRRLA